MKIKLYSNINILKNNYNYDFSIKWILKYQTINALKQNLVNLIIIIKINLYTTEIYCFRSTLNFCLIYFKYSISYLYNILIDLVIIDSPGKFLRYKVKYLLLSLKYNSRLIISIFTNEIIPITSIYSLYINATWMEREVFDMFGILFIKQYDLRRILTDYAFKGFPLRKDFPLTGYIELSFNDIKKCVVISKVSLAQEFRIYQFRNPWRKLR